MARRVCRPATLQRLLSLRHTQLPKSRNFLSASYRCDDVWNKRLDNPLVSSVNLGDFYYDLDRKFKREGKVSAIDVDLFVNRIDNPRADGVVEELEELIHRLRRSPETVDTLESTHCAVLRVLLDGGYTDTLTRLLAQPMSYGLFPDHPTCNLLMHTFLERKEYTVIFPKNTTVNKVVYFDLLNDHLEACFEKTQAQIFQQDGASCHTALDVIQWLDDYKIGRIDDWPAAARVAVYLMLQEDFGPPLTQALVLASCYCYTTTQDNQPWEDYMPKVEEPQEEVKIRVKFLRNPYFDDHFDLTEPHPLLGKTLAWVSPLVGGLAGRSCGLLGWALYGKWEELAAALDRVATEKEPIAASVVVQIKSLVEGVEDVEARERLLSGVGRVEAAEGLVVEQDLWLAITQLAQDAARAAEPLDIKAQEENYRRWEEQREEEYQRQVQAYKKQQLLAEIEEKKQELTAREEVIYFFDNKEKLSMMLPEKKKFYPKRSPAYPKKKRPREVDEAYIPPDV
ncbi:28S ribosomal protein S27, mitochondrial [Chionoecetes opilio]|uniref:28S ribosomal protein S27, mitochondrial n=1 Tax=Chionoecetes opilio TaxID=41210 RepID=A0A8J4Y8K3_CHIOP|nr:28S ribosomal protein S27, mitochondrial [Chionoecetes opilio]